MLGRCLLIAACLLFTWLSVRNAAQHLLSSSKPALAAKFWPADGTSLATLAQDRVIEAGGTVDATSMALARAALKKSPRAAVPLVLTGFAASAAGDLDHAQALMEAARARQPRTETAVFWLVDHDMRTGQYAAALDLIRPAMALRPGSREALIDLVGALATVPAAHHALVAKLETQPSWRGAFFGREAAAALPPRTILSLLESLPPASDPEAARAEQQAVIASLLRQNDYAGAYGVWLSFLAPAQRPAPGTTYDPNFAGLPGAAPFNWSLQPRPDVGVTRAKLADVPDGSGLAIEFRAAVPRPIASELIAVPSGSYLLSLRGRRVADATADGHVDVKLVCVEGGRTLANLAVDPLSSEWRSFQTDLTVPPTCAFATVAVSGEPGEAFGAVSAQITALNLSRK